MELRGSGRAGIQMSMGSPDAGKNTIHCQLPAVAAGVPGDLGGCRGHIELSCWTLTTQVPSLPDSGRCLCSLGDASSVCCFWKATCSLAPVCPHTLSLPLPLLGPGPGPSLPSRCRPFPLFPPASSPEPPPLLQLLPASPYCSPYPTIPTGSSSSPSALVLPPFSWRSQASGWLPHIS